jgi:hypothetical protein
MAREAYLTGFWSRGDELLKSGVSLRAGKTCFRKDGAPFGTNYFTTDLFHTGFLGSANAYVWERDFAEMEKHGVTFVRTGVWNGHADLFDKVTGGVEESVLRSLEAFLLSARRHNIQVHFTFYAFDPQTVRRFSGEEPLQFGPGTNRYTDPIARRAVRLWCSLAGKGKSWRATTLRPDTGVRKLIGRPRSLQLCGAKC